MLNNNGPATILVQVLYNFYDRQVPDLGRILPRFYCTVIAADCATKVPEMKSLNLTNNELNLTMNA